MTASEEFGGHLDLAGLYCSKLQRAHKLNGHLYVGSQAFREVVL